MSKYARPIELPQHAWYLTIVTGPVMLPAILLMLD